MVVSWPVSYTHLEKVSKKHLMGAFHGGWSLGGFAGAGVLLVLLKILSLHCLLYTSRCV